MKPKTKAAIEKKLVIVEKALEDIRVLLAQEEDLPILTTEYGTYLVPRRVEFCEHCMGIKSQVGYADVEIADYEADKNCMPNVTWCRSCGETNSTGVLAK